MKPAPFIVAFSIYLALNLFALPLLRRGFDPYDYSYRSWPWWLIHHLRSTGETFNVALLGSSLMLGSINQCDANFANKNVDATSHHQSLYLDGKLDSTFGGVFRTFNLATPGQMPSDAYLLAKAMLQLGQQPKLFIYGIAPRDFMDSRLVSPADTEPFRYLKRFVPVGEIACDAYGLNLALVNNWLQHCLFLYQHAIDIQLAFSNQVDALLKALMPGTSITYWDRVKLLPTYKAGELYPGASVDAPVAWTNAIMPWKRDNIEDYIERYRKPNPDTFNLQLCMLNRLVSLCHERDIKIVLVNMPLSTLNINLLGQQRYREFVRNIRTFCIAGGVTLIDFDNPALFGNECFEDSAHLNGFGGKRLIDLLTEKMKDDAELSKVLVTTGKTFSPALASREHEQ